MSAAGFLGGARSRLLPASVPLRFFGAAVVFHLLAWAALLAGAERLPRFAGGLSWPLAGLHLLTLGVLVMSAIGASLQLLPVATRQPVAAGSGPALVWWLYTPGVAAVALGMGLAWPALLGAGAAAVAAALLVYALLLAANLRGARGMPGVVGHGWAALACLLVTLATALSLAGAYLGWPGLDRGPLLALHVTFAGYGFMGLLALGLSAILVPMFALAEAPGTRAQLLSGAFALAALLLAALAAFGVAPLLLRLAALACAGVAVTLHLRQMQRALASGMRRSLGRSFVLVRLSWVLLVASLLAALALVLDAPLPGLQPLFGLLLVGGWLLSFLLGILQRVLPFLASMHAAGSGKRPPTPSSLSAERPLALHFHCHWAALALLAAAIVADSMALAALAAGIGLLGAVAFLAFYVILLRRLRAAARPAGA